MEDMAIPSLWDLTEILVSTKKIMDVKSTLRSLAQLSLFLNFYFCFFTGPSINITDALSFRLYCSCIFPLEEKRIKLTSLLLLLFFGSYHIGSHVG